MADEKTTGGKAQEDPTKSQPEAPNVEQRLAMLEKMQAETARTLDEERKSSAGKDRKITELADEKRKLQESTLSKDKLLEIREQEQKEREKEWAEKNATERLELEQLRIKTLRQEVLAGLAENFPMFLADRVRGGTKEEIEADARMIMGKWVKDRTLTTNAAKVTGRPQSGDGRQGGAQTKESVEAMSSADRKKWAATAPKEERDRIFDEIANSGIEQ